MKVYNMIGRSGKAVANQFYIEGEGQIPTEYFQSYDSIIAKHEFTPADGWVTTLDEKYWDYSRTTLKYLSMFLNSHTHFGLRNKKEIEKLIEMGEIKLANLNGDN